MLTGEDELVPMPDAATPPDSVFAIRFHLHPQVRARYAEDGRSILLALQHGPAWRFAAEGAVVLSLEESIYFGSPEGPRRSEQIVLQGTTADTRIVRWSFEAFAA